MKAIKIYGNIYSLENIRSVEVEGANGYKIHFKYTGGMECISPGVDIEEINDFIDTIFEKIS